MTDSELEKMNEALNYKINLEVERRAHEWLEAAKGADWTKLFEDQARENVDLRNLLRRALKFIADPELRNDSMQAVLLGGEIATVLKSQTKESS